MHLGNETIELVRSTPPGPPVPDDSRSNDLWFQHLAIPTGDMAAAVARLARCGPRPISTTGPVLLPPENGSVTAWKFRDPDGHPLELIHFPSGPARWQGAGLTLGIDHSALAVADTAASLRFYADLGFHPAARSHNHGPAQSRLDGLADADATITSLRFPAGPGLELLAYHPAGRPMPEAPDGLWVDWTTLSCPGLPEPRLLRDPDGHRVVLAAG